MLDTAPRYRLRDAALPEEMGFLLQRYPRDDWNAHPGFKDKTRHWMGAHQMFRQVAKQLRRDTESLLNKDMALGDYVGRLSYFGGGLVANLHGHHGWEDHQYFPELAAADPRFAAGLALLEQDHADLDRVLDDLTRKANRVIQLASLEERQAWDEANGLLPATEAIEAFLKRHLADEEDLTVPIILHHRLRG